jgi:hypothetical protein
MYGLDICQATPREEFLSWLLPCTYTYIQAANGLVEKLHIYVCICERNAP